MADKEGKVAITLRQFSTLTGLSTKQIRTAIATLVGAQIAAQQRAHQNIQQGTVIKLLFDLQLTHGAQQRAQLGAQVKRVKKQIKQPVDKPVDNSPDMQILAAFGDEYKQRFGITYMAQFGADRVRLKKPLEIYPPELIISCIPVFFNDLWVIETRNYTLATFINMLPKLLATIRVRTPIKTHEDAQIEAKEQERVLALKDQLKALPDVDDMPW